MLRLVPIYVVDQNSSSESCSILRNLPSLGGRVVSSSAIATSLISASDNNAARRPVPTGRGWVDGHRGNHSIRSLELLPGSEPAMVGSGQYDENQDCCRHHLACSERLRDAAARPDRDGDARTR